MVWYRPELMQKPLRPYEPPRPPCFDMLAMMLTLNKLGYRRKRDA